MKRESTWKRMFLFSYVILAHRGRLMQNVVMITRALPRDFQASRSCTKLYIPAHVLPHEIITAAHGRG